ncbi:hypothetical protein L6452_01326 [Arctium lappa]|uniref:Uncharacterized protein n=1 Tax=Arctium lappa TaxID=4217 RepID=A0ACB9FHN0_ARCLA|nr:hypothetical protein L6452_01326 [Arctium lappa]
MELSTMVVVFSTAAEVVCAEQKENVTYLRKKGTQGVIEVENPNMPTLKTLKARDADKTTKPSRRRSVKAARVEADVSLSGPSNSQATTTTEKYPVIATPPPDDHENSSTSDESPILESPDATTATSTSITSTVHSPFLMEVPITSEVELPSNPITPPSPPHVESVNDSSDSDSDDTPMKLSVFHAILANAHQ